MAWVSIADKIREAAADVEKEAGATALGDKEKKFVKMPSERPPRREINPVSSTREYRNEYQKQYREQNGNGYIPKPKKKKEEDND